ncbi:hypothetical protein HYV88_04570 [Candidatus Woesearchaeota archaeon]|nr:hypothetical protein [Candidatus Woesearchaeota archaeon]
MNKNGMAESLEIISAFILIIVVLLFSYIIFGIMGERTTTEIGAGSYSDFISESLIQDISFSISNLETEYDSLSNLIASKEDDKIKLEMEKIQKNIKETTGKNIVLEVYSEEQLKEKEEKFILPIKVSFPDRNGEKIIFLVYEKNE